MTTLSEIRELETRLHSHFLEWSDVPLQNELLYLLDELQQLHGEFDKRDIPLNNLEGLEMSLKERLFYAFCVCKPQQAAKELPSTLYGKPERRELKQRRLF
jgi:hypothetical protein